MDIEIEKQTLAGNIGPGGDLDEEEQLDLLLGRFPISQKSVISTVRSTPFLRSLNDIRVGCVYQMCLESRLLAFKIKCFLIVLCK